MGQRQPDDRSKKEPIPSIINEGGSTISFTADDLQKAIEALENPQQQAIARLFFLQNKTRGEISEALDEEVDRVNRLLKKAVIKLIHSSPTIGQAIDAWLKKGGMK